MVDGELLGKILSWPVAAWATFCLVAVHYLRARNERLRDMETEKNGDWKRLHAEIVRCTDRIVALEIRCDHLQKEVDECREREGEWMRRAIAAEAASEGIGEARQEAQRIVSTEMQSLKPKGESQ